MGFGFVFKEVIILENIHEKLRELGYSPFDEAFYLSRLPEWERWYEGNVKDFHSYFIYNGSRRVRQRRFSLGMAKKVSEDWANLLMNEKVKIHVSGAEEQRFFDAFCRENRFDACVNSMQERKAALGTAAYVFAVDGLRWSPEAGTVQGPGKRIALTCLDAPHIIPLSWANGVITECAFTSDYGCRGHRYVYLQIHRLNGGCYDICNLLFEADGALREVPLATVPGLRDVPAVFRTGLRSPLFVIDRLNITNNCDRQSPMGIAVFANAIDQLKGVDIVYDSYVNEFVLGKKRILVKPSALKNLDGEPAFDVNDVCFYVLPEDAQDTSLVHEIDMQLRAEQDCLNLVAMACGFAENHYRFDSGHMTTATQIVSENSSMFRTIRKHELVLEEVLKDLVRTALVLGKEYLGLPLNPDAEVTVDFDDSIIDDTAVRFDRDLKMLQAGALTTEEFRRNWINTKGSKNGIDKSVFEKSGAG